MVDYTARRAWAISHPLRRSTSLGFSIGRSYWRCLYLNMEEKNVMERLVAGYQPACTEPTQRLDKASNTLKTSVEEVDDDVNLPTRWRAEPFGVQAHVKCCMALRNHVAKHEQMETMSMSNPWRGSLEGFEASKKREPRIPGSFYEQCGLPQIHTLLLWYHGLSIGELCCLSLKTSIGCTHIPYYDLIDNESVDQKRTKQEAGAIPPGVLYDLSKILESLTPTQLAGDF